MKNGKCYEAVISFETACTQQKKLFRETETGEGKCFDEVKYYNSDLCGVVATREWLD